MKYKNIKEEELKNKIAADYFHTHDCTKIIGNIDFSVAVYQNEASLLEPKFLVWGEAKKGASDVRTSFVQLILTIGKARTFDHHLPPDYLAALDGEKIAFIPYNDISDIFYLNDFNWKVAPSNHDTKEFKLVKKRIEKIIDSGARVYNYERDNNDLHGFIRAISLGKNHATKIKIDKNNFMVIYNKWLAEVRDSIAIDWDLAKKSNIIDGDFYLADLLSQENKTLKEKLYVLLKINHYELERNIDAAGLLASKDANFRDGQQAHHQFWNKYERPPKEEYWDYIIERRDLLVPQDVRERKGTFFTPRQWVELSQKYLADALGENWQDDYVVWDPAGGTGNLLAGLTNKHNLWVSDIDKQNIEVMQDRIANGANLLGPQVFQFDFLNDDFVKLPKPLQNIINNPVKRKKLVIYMNPPYAEATNSKTIKGTGKNKAGVATDHKMDEKIKEKIGTASNEIFIRFMVRIYEKCEGCILGQFSTLKFVSGTYFSKFQEYFLAKYLGGFVVPADTFDNVKGQFPIGFTLWDLGQKEKIGKISCDVFDEKENNLGKKKFYGDLPESLNKWIIKFDDNNNQIGLMVSIPPDFQHNNQVAILITPQERYCLAITRNNLVQFCIYFSVRHCLSKTWLNDRDQFLSPNDGWQNDTEFQNDCLAYTLFHGQNKITTKDGTNHWIPFTAQEVGAKGQFDSTFMTDFMAGKLAPEKNTGLELEVTTHRTTPLKFSAEARAVFSAGRALWRYYHQQSFDNINASFYDIREFFQGRNKKGRMNPTSPNEQYNELIKNLRTALTTIEQKIEPKIYDYGFLKK